MAQQLSAVFFLQQRQIVNRTQEQSLNGRPVQLAAVFFLQQRQIVSRRTEQALNDSGVSISCSRDKYSS